MTTARQVEDATPSNLVGGVEPEDGVATSEQGPQQVQVSRRKLVRGAAIAGTVVAVGAGLAACSTASTKAAAPATGPTPGTPGATTKPGATGATSPAKAVPTTGVPPAAAASGDQFAEFGIGKASSVPVGGGVVDKSHGVVITQPTKGNFKCFSASCTHLGCMVNKVENGLIVCPCHGAKFSIVDGSPKAGPATRPLTAQEFSVKNGEVVLD
jgi:Rieske Fe-S protein